MKKIIFIVVLFIVIIEKSDGQNLNSRFDIFASYSIINDYAIDALTNKIYYVSSTKSSGGGFVHRLMTINANTGNILTAGQPIILPTGNSEVKSIVFTNNKIFIGGNDELGGNGFLYKLDIISGAIDINWNSTLLTNLPIEEIKHMTTDNINLYISGREFFNNSGTFVVDVSNGNYTPIGQVGIPPYFELLQSNKLEVVANEIRALADDGLYVYNKLNYNFIKKLALGMYSGITSNFFIANDTAFITGNFLNPYTSEKNIACLKYEYTNNAMLPWNFMDSSCTNSAQYTSAIIPFSRTLIVGGVIENKSCVISNFYSANTVYPDSLTPFNGVLRSGFPVYQDSIKTFKILGNKLFLLSNKKSFFAGGTGGLKTDTTSLGSFCLIPEAPSTFINKKIAVCKGEQNVSYSIPYQGASLNYNWAYSGLGATILGTNNAITINFSNTSTSGILSVFITTECGTQSNALNLNITVNPFPQVFAGKDTNLTCINSHVMLYANPAVPNVSFIWQLPNSSTSNNDSILASIGGIYVLKITDNSTTCKNYDTLHLGIDTLPPIINVSPSFTITNCTPGDTTVFASSNNSNDTIYWIGTTTLTNPATLNAPVGQTSGQNYTVVAIGKNGCSSTALVNVTNMTTAPILTIPPGLPFDNISYTLDTLTCLRDSVLLNFTSFNPNTLIYSVQNGDTLPNNSYVDTAGIYAVYIVDTVTGCDAGPILFKIVNNFTPPVLNIVTSNPIINCSNAAVILNADSGTPNVSLTWSGPTNFSSSDPATVSQIGNYIVTASNPINGCIKTDSVTVSYQNSLTLSSTADTLICKGDSVMLTSIAIGGTPGFNYSWNNNSSNSNAVVVSPTTTSQYIITITDAVGCIGLDTMNVTIPSAIKDSIISFAPCDQQNPNGQIQIFATGGIPPYLFSINNSAMQVNSTFDSLNVGNYSVIIKDSLGCVFSDTHTISTQSLSPTADFIISTTMMQADTFVVVDISNPRPDTVIWTFPSTITVINNNPFAPVIISSDTGSVQVSIEAHFGTCVSHLTKNVKFIKPDTLALSPNGNGIESIIIFPNPNTGQFSVEVKLYKKQTFAIYVYNAQGIEQMRATFSELNYGLSAFSLNNPTPGTYFIKVIAEYDSKSKFFSVTQ